MLGRKASDPDARSVVLFAKDNYGLCEIREYRKAVDVLVWGGVSANCAEDALSSFVLRQKAVLKRFVFVPKRTKGGRMVRPHYKSGDRSSKEEFPALHTLGYFGDMGTPKDALWLCPNLRQLYVFRSDDAGKYRSDAKVDAMWDPTVGDCAQRALAECPLLESITYGDAHLGLLFSFDKIWTLKPPSTLPWNVLRLLAIVIKKEDVIECPMAGLPSVLIDYIIGFVHVPKWRKILPES